VSSRPEINHVEMLFQPGEREAARAFFESLGFTVSDFGPWLFVFVDLPTANGTHNVMYASEPVPAQQRFEDALAQAIANHPEASAALDHFREVRVAHPQFTFHFGASIPTHAEWAERTERIKEAARSHPLLKGRVEVSVFNPGDPGGVGNNVYQTFIITEILATGSLQTGLIFEFQHYTSTLTPGEIDLEALSGTATYPDPKSIV
jgi:hypothetical protein